MQEHQKPTRAPRVSRLAAALRQGLLASAVLFLAPAFAATTAASDADTPHATPTAAAAKKSAVVKHATPQAKAKESGKSAKSDSASKGAKSAKAGKGTKAAKKEAVDPTPGPLADFGKAEAPPDVMQVANWVSYTRNAKKKAFVVIDKKQAHMYVFEPSGKLRNHSPILLGKAVGDDTAPGIGNKPMSQIREDEKTTPAGRFLAQPGKNSHGEDIIWIDYNAAVSMHRMRMVSPEERRAERMATPDASDNRISYGCVNVPPAFYNSVLRPTVGKYGAYVYVLPETKSAQQVFGAFDVTAAAKAAPAATSAASVPAKAGG